MSNIDRFDISVVINGHREGLLLLASLRSAVQAIEEAIGCGLRCEMIVVLDRPDELTTEMASHPVHLHLDSEPITVNFGDLGKSRNAAVARARGTYVAFLDGDDLWCPGWLRDSFMMAALDSRTLVLHPAVNLFFGHNPHVFAHADMDDPNFRIAVLAFTNIWTSLCFAPRELLQRCPYPKTDLPNQIGYEDWGWNMRAITAGAVHKTVPNTLHAVRNKAVSLVRQTAAAGCFPAYPLGLFKSTEKNDG